MALIFDLDGTLIDSLRIHKAATNYAIKSVLDGHNIPKSFMDKAIRYPSPILLRLAAQKFHLNLNSEIYKEIMKKKLDIVTDENIAAQVKIYPGVVELFKLLRDNGIRFCIATSMNTTELKKFTRVLKLKKISKIIINPDSHAHEKPNPYIVNKSVSILGVKKKKVFYVGDSPYDAVTSKRAHVNFIGVFNKKELGAEDEFYKDIKELALKVKKNIERFKD